MPFISWESLYIKSMVVILERFEAVIKGKKGSYGDLRGKYLRLQQ